jgi:hypothetical protein
MYKFSLKYAIENNLVGKFRFFIISSWRIEFWLFCYALAFIRVFPLLPPFLLLLSILSAVEPFSERTAVDLNDGALAGGGGFN